jgi:hypothetical protein
MMSELKKAVSGNYRVLCPLSRSIGRRRDLGTVNRTKWRNSTSLLRRRRKAGGPWIIICWRKRKLPIEPPPNPVKAAEAIQKMLAWVEPTEEAFKKRNQEAKLFPSWQETQLLGFMRYVGLYASDLNRSYSSNRVDSLAQALRNLTELDVWIEFCGLSVENSKRFFDDMARDIREVIETHNRVHLHKHKTPYEGFDDLIKRLTESSATLQITNLEGKFTPVSQAAKEIGRDLRYASMYKVASKYAHPTSLLLSGGNEERVLMDRFYDVGAHLAYSCVITIQNTITTRYPNFEL